MLLGFGMTTVQRRTGPPPKAFQECQVIHFLQCFESASGNTRCLAVSIRIYIYILSLCWFVWQTLTKFIANIHQHSVSGDQRVDCHRTRSFSDTVVSWLSWVKVMECGNQLLQDLRMGFILTDTVEY